MPRITSTYPPLVLHTHEDEASECIRRPKVRLDGWGAIGVDIRTAATFDKVIIELFSIPLN